MKKSGWIFAIFGLLAGTLAALIRALAFFPKPHQPEPIHNLPDAPLLPAGQPLKVMTFNVQYMAGKNYIFYYDGGPDRRPSRADISKTVAEVARIIQDEDPDIVLLQEVDDGSKRTDYEDQLARLLQLMPDNRYNHASAFYWQVKYVPIPQINGRVSMKLTTLSKYRIETAVRHQLTQYPPLYFWQHFMPKRAILETRLPVTDGTAFTVLNTHLELFSFGTDVQRAQIEKVEAVIAQQGSSPWILGGDFNMLPPEAGGDGLSDFEQGIYGKTAVLSPLFHKHNAIPRLQDTQQADREKWYTHFPNGKDETRPNKTIDYLFFAKTMTPLGGYVRQHDTLHISDHLPLIAEVRVVSGE